MGIELVEGRDLFVKDETSSTCARRRGRKRVDVIYRRIDDDFLDPLAFRPDSALGVPGLMSAYQAGNVTLANAVGTGVADDKAVYSYMPEIVRFYPRRGADPEERADLALPRGGASRLRARPSRRAGGEGGARLRRLRHAGRPDRRQGEIAAFRAKLKRIPTNFIAQPTLALSTCPTCVEAGVAPRHVDLRPFVLTGRDRIRIVPGGLTRVALQGGLAGRQFQPGRRHQGHLGAGR